MVTAEVREQMLSFSAATSGGRFAYSNSPLTRRIMQGEYVNANQYQNLSRNGEHFWTRPNCSWSRFGHQQISRKAV